MKLSAFLTGLVLTLPSVLAAAILESDTKSGAMIPKSSIPAVAYRSSGSNSLVARQSDEEISREDIITFTSEARTTVSQVNYSRTVVDWASQKWPQYNWRMYLSSYYGGESVVLTPSPTWGENANYTSEITGLELPYTLNPFPNGTMTVPLTADGTDPSNVAYSGNIISNTVADGVRTVVFGNRDPLPTSA